MMLSRRTYFYSPMYTAHYERIYPFRKILLVCGAVGLICGLAMFILTPILFVTTESFNPGFVALGFSAFIVIFLGAVSCQCGCASIRWHDIRQLMSQDGQTSTIITQTPYYGYTTQMVTPGGMAAQPLLAPSYSNPPVYAPTTEHLQMQSGFPHGYGYTSGNQVPTELPFPDDYAKANHFK